MGAIISHHCDRCGAQIARDGRCDCPALQKLFADACVCVYGSTADQTRRSFACALLRNIARDESVDFALTSADALYSMANGAIDPIVVELARGQLRSILDAIFAMLSPDASPSAAGLSSRMLLATAGAVATEAASFTLGYTPVVRAAKPASHLRVVHGDGDVTTTAGVRQ